jgi:tetratricopeptide (TPR) repeat protein
LGQYTQCLAEMNLALTLNPNPARFYALRGDAYRGLGEWALAIHEYDTALSKEPLVLAYHNRGLAHEQLGDYVQALDSYNRAIELDPAAAESYYGRGVALEMIGDYDRARDEYQMVLQLSSEADILTQARQRLQSVMGYL